MVLVGLVFSTVGPMLVPFSALYFAMGRVVWTHQLTQVYAAGVGDDSRGMLWMHMMDKVGGRVWPKARCTRGCEETARVSHLNTEY